MDSDVAICALKYPDQKIARILSIVSKVKPEILTLDYIPIMLERGIPRSLAFGPEDKLKSNTRQDTREAHLGLLVSLIDSFRVDILTEFFHRANLELLQINYYLQLCI